MFKDINELRNCIEVESVNITKQHEDCYYCGGSLIDNCGFEEFILYEEYAPGYKFCSEYCLEQYLLKEVGLENKAEG